MKLTLAELVVYLIANGYAKGITEAIRLMGFKEGEFSGIRQTVN